MQIRLVQNIIDIFRGKKELKLVDKPDGITIPKAQLPYACFTTKYTIWCRGYKNAKKIIDHNKKKMNLMGLYRKENTWNIKDNIKFKEIYQGQKKFIDEKVIPLIKNTDIICDVGCASGEFTFMFAPYCKQIEGVEYFQKFVDSANNQAKEENIHNIIFYQGDINNYKFDKKYNHILLMGLLPHIFENNKAEAILKKISNSLYENGYLTIKANVTTNNEDYFRIRANHTVIFHSLKKLKQFLNDAGFILVCEDKAKTTTIQLAKINETIEANHWMALYKKIN